MAFFDRSGGRKKPETPLTPEEIKKLVEEADALCENEEYDRAFVLDKRAAEAGDARAQTHMGWYFENGCGAPCNPAKAFEWYSKAAMQNFAPAQFCIGMCYEEGIGTPADPAKARHYYRLAADQGMEDAIEALTRLGTEEQPETPRLSDIQIQRIADEARRLFVQEEFELAAERAREAAEYSHPQAMHVLGACLLRNITTALEAAEAEKWLRASADAGFAPAMLDLGIAYSQGEVFPKNFATAARLFEAAVNAKSRPAYFWLGSCYEYGEGVQRDIARAVELYALGAEAGDPAAQFSYGQCFMTGTGVDENYDEAEKYFRAAADQGYAPAAESLKTLEDLRAPEEVIEEITEEIMEKKLADAEKFISDHNYDAARPLIEECAEVGMPRAQTIMGDFYAKAIAGYPRDSSKALEWYRHGADGGDVSAMMGAAEILETTGVGAEAIKFYEKAHHAGNTDAAYRLGRIFENGKGVAKDDVLAFTWYLVAANAGDKLSQRIVGSMYETGRGTGADPAQAMEWYKKAAEAGDIAAKKAVERLSRPAGAPETPKVKKETPRPAENLTPEQIAHLINRANELYDEGDYDSAADIDKRLAEAGNPRGINSLGWDYYKGHGVPQDTAHAFDLYMRAAQAGEPRAMINLACAYEDGEGCPKDEAEALKWFRRAAEAGHANGYYNLGRCYHYGIGTGKNETEALKYYTKAAGLGSANAYFGMGLLHETLFNDYKKANDCYYQAVCLGCYAPAFTLALNIENGNGAPVDIERAVYFYRIAVIGEIEEAREELDRLDRHVRLSEDELQAAVDLCKATYDTDRALALEQALLPTAMGNPWSAEIVALCLTYGTFTDNVRAAKMFLIAAKAGLSSSQDNLGWFYENGRGFEKDPESACHWYGESARQGNVHAMTCYAWCLNSGFGCVTDYRSAIEWYTKAADANDPRAIYNLGVMHERGEGTPVDYDEARRLYTRAAGLDYEPARKALENIKGKTGSGAPDPLEAEGREADKLYSDGKYDEAFAKARRPADAGNVTACLVMGLCYEFARGTAKDMKQAVKYYKVAADGGNRTAMLNLGVAYQYGYGGLSVDLRRATELYRAAAEKGDRLAQCNLGYCYECGDGVEKDMKQAAYWYRKAADQGNHRAEAYLGECYEKATGVEQDYKTAFDLYYKAAAGGNTYGQMRLGRCYEYAIGIGKNIDEAVRWYTKAADGGNKYAKERLEAIRKGSTNNITAEVIEEGSKASAAYRNRNYAEAIRLARKPAELGEPYASEVLALCYDFGYGVTRDDAMAERYYRIAADQGLAVSQLNLGVILENRKQYKEAVDLYRKAAEQGNANAQCNLAYCYEKGIGLTKDLTLAVEWYRKAADQGNARAQLNLGICYEFGNGVAKDAAQAVRLYRQSAENGNRIAQCNLGYCYESGTGIAKDMTQAAAWYRKSADQGWARGQAYLGECYETGQGITRDISRAVELYRKAADQGHAYGQYRLGLCYEKGTGVPQNKSKARELYQKAADGGNKAAKERLKNL